VKVEVAAPHLYRTEAVVLKRVDLGEADRILTLFTPRFGKIRAVAKGVRRPTSRIGGHVELFTRSEMLIAKGRNLDIVTQSDTIDSYLGLRNDLLRTTYAYYVAELLDSITEEGIEAYPVFELLVQTLERLASGADPRIVARFFDLQLLRRLGHGPELYICVHCQEQLKPVVNFFSASAGGTLCPKCASADPTAKVVSIPAQKVLRVLHAGDYSLASRLHLTPNLLHELESLAYEYVRFVIERELKSADFLAGLRAQRLEGTQPSTQGSLVDEQERK